MSLSEVLERCYAALDRGDPQAFLDLYDSEIELFVPGASGLDAGLVRGADPVNRWHANYFAQWSDQHWEVAETLEHGGTVASVVNRTGTGRRSGVTLNGSFFTAMTFSEGKLVTIVHLGGYDDLLER
jgi:ketosteroid isomerase-like protein